MNKMNLEPGVKYRGTGWLNEYGEFQFQPEQKGSKPSNLKIVHQDGDFVIYESAHLWQVKVNFKKTNIDTTKFMAIFSAACGKLLKYFGEPLKTTKTKKV